MKIKKNEIPKIIFYILAGAVIVLMAGFLLSHRISGKAAVTLNGEKYLLTDMDCTYLDHDGENVKTRCVGSAPLHFISGGFQYGMYEYSFPVSNEEISIRPRIRVFKTNIYDRCRLDINVDIVKEEGMWNGDITVKANGRTYRETFADIEHNEIMLRVE